MTRDLDEMGKERTMKVRCQYEGVCGNKECHHRSDHKYTDYCDSHSEYWNCNNASKCIPVEPERVKGWYCANPEGCYSTDGIPDVHPATCAGGCEWLRRRSPGLLQRMGMATWVEERDWVVIVRRPDGSGGLCNVGGNSRSVYFGTKDESKEFMDSGTPQTYRENQYRRFRWQDGLR